MMERRLEEKLLGKIWLKIDNRPAGKEGKWRKRDPLESCNQKASKG